jgi:CBS domain-containing protein
VVDERECLVGIVTETDFVRAAYSLLGGRVPVDQLMDEEHEAEDV